MLTVTRYSLKEKGSRNLCHSLPNPALNCCDQMAVTLKGIISQYLLVVNFCHC